MNDNNNNINIPFEIKTVAIIGAGNGGKSCAGDLALQGLAVRLFEFPQWTSNLDAIREDRILYCSGEVEGEAKLEKVTDNLKEAVEGVDAVIVCTQAGSLIPIAKDLAPMLTKNQLVVLNPGSTGGALVFLKEFREYEEKMTSAQQQLENNQSLNLEGEERKFPVCKAIVEFDTLTYGCRAVENKVNVAVKVKKVVYGVIPTSQIEAVQQGGLTKIFPALKLAPSSGTVLEAGLNNGNPIIHPAITLLNVGAMENRGSAYYFYKDGVSPMVANLMKKIDEERMAIMKALGYQAQSDPETSVEEGYATNGKDYYQCYARGEGFSQFRAPNSLVHCRYFHEDIAYGLVLYCSLGRLLGVNTDASLATARFGGIVYDCDYYSSPEKRTVEDLALSNLSLEQIQLYLQTGIYPFRSS